MFFWANFGGYKLVGTKVTKTKQKTPDLEEEFRIEPKTLFINLYLFFCCLGFIYLFMFLAFKLYMIWYKLFANK